MATTDNLTTLANAKQWIMSSPNGVNQTLDDLLLQRLIDQASRFIISWLSIGGVASRTYTGVFSGTGSSRMVLPNWPVTSISSLSISGTTVAEAATVLLSGYLLAPWDGTPPAAPQLLALNGYTFYKAMLNVTITYQAGYLISDESQTAAASVSVSAPYGNWSADVGVTYDDGTALTKVTGTPAVGEYALSQNIPGTYVFAAADYGEEMLISYSFVPSDLEQACCEVVAERYAYRTRVGQTSKNIGVGGETVSFSQKDLSDYVKTLLRQYQRVVPF